MKKIFRSFVFAWQGLLLVFKSEMNFRIQFFVFLVVLSLSFYFSITKIEWLFVLIISALVFSLEACNTALEKLCDKVSPEIHPLIKKVKDIAAASVLIASIFAFLIGCLIFWPYIQ